MGVDSMADIPDDERTNALGLFNTARSYWRSAEHLNAAQLKVSHPHAPVTFLYCHAIELYLKSYLRAAGNTVSDLKKIGHRIARLAEAAAAAGLRLDPDKAEVLSHIDDWDVAIEARYIVTGFSRQPSNEAFGSVAEQLDQVIAPFLRSKGHPVREQQFGRPVVSPITEGGPLRFVQVDIQTICASVKIGAEPGTHLTGHWNVTNTSGGPFVLLKARVAGHDAVSSNVATRHRRGDLFSVTYPILPGRMTQVGANFMFSPPIHVDGQAFAADVIFTDNYENEHRAKSVKFRPIGDSPSPPRSSWSPRG